MTEDSFDFVAFGIKDNLKSLVKRTGVFELITGIYSLCVSACLFLLFIALLFFNSWGESVFDFFGFKQIEGVVIGALFISYVVIMGALFLVLGAFSIWSGLRSKKYSNNPVTLIEGKKDYLTSAIVYIVLMAFMIFSIYICIAYHLTLFIFLIILALLAVLTITLYKFLAIKNVPDKTSVLDVQNLPEAKKQEILLKSNTAEVFEDVKIKKPKRKTKKNKNII